MNQETEEQIFNVSDVNFETDFSPTKEEYRTLRSVFSSNVLFVNQDKLRPQMESEEWSDWVLAQLRKDEKYDQKPTCDGLRRIAIGLFGPMDMTTTVHNVDMNYAAVTCVLAWPSRVISGSAEVHVNNTDPPFNQYPLASAETRAIGRALRLALNLRRVITAEEASRKADISVPITDEIRANERHTSTQAKFIDLLCKKHNISVESVTKAAISPNVRFDDVTNAQAIQIQALIEDWIKNRPENIEAYDPLWVGKFP